jgi:hypothetical protein
MPDAVIDVTCSVCGREGTIPLANHNEATDFGKYETTTTCGPCVRQSQAKGREAYRHRHGLLKKQQPS